MGKHPCGPMYQAMEAVVEILHLQESLFDSFSVEFKSCLAAGGMNAIMPKNRMSYLKAAANVIADTEGGEISAFEKEVEAFLNVKKAYFVTSGTSALVVAVQALGIGLGDEVIMPTYTWIATPGSVTVNGGIPIMVDVDQTLGINPQILESYITPRTKAILAVHMQGVPCNITAIRDIAQRRGLYLIEDNAQSFGSTVHGKMIGTFGQVGITSTNPSKTFQTGGQGGLVWTNDEKVAERLLWAIDNRVAAQARGALENIPFAGHDFRGSSEWHAAYGRVELSHLSSTTNKMLGFKLAFRKALKPEYQKLLQWQEDPAGDRSYAIWFVLKSEEQSKCLKKQFSTEPYSFGFTFDHYYIHYIPHYPTILEKYSWHDSGFPWISKDDQKHNKYEEYAVSNDIMKRTMRIILSYYFTTPMIVWLADVLNSKLDMC